MSILPSFCLFLCLSRRFLGVALVVFFNFDIVLEIYMKFFMKELDFESFFFFFPINWENRPKMGQKQVFLKIYWKVCSLNFYWIFSIMKICLIYCVPTQISYLGKFCSADMFSANQIVGFFSRWYLQNSERAWFLQVNTNSHKLKVDQKMFGWEWSEIGVASVVMVLENWLFLKNK